MSSRIASLLYCASVQAKYLNISLTDRGRINKIQAKSFSLSFSLPFSPLSFSFSSARNHRCGTIFSRRYDRNKDNSS